MVAAIIEDTFSLIVCNVPVVVTFLLRHVFVFGEVEARRVAGDDNPMSTFVCRKDATSGITTVGFGRSGVTVSRTVETDTVRDVTMINLWEMSTSTSEVSKDVERKGIVPVGSSMKN